MKVGPIISLADSIEILVYEVLNFVSFEFYSDRNIYVEECRFVDTFKVARPLLSGNVDVVHQQPLFHRSYFPDSLKL